MNKIISVSMMCADIFNLNAELKAFEEKNIGYLHFDIMDGIFVDNLMLSNDFMKQVRCHTRIPFDIHLMIIEPDDKIDWFDIRENDIVTIHLESSKNITLVLQKIKKLNAKVGLAIKPSTEVNEIKDFVQFLDLVLVMTVNPGHAGQKMHEESFERIKSVRKLLNDMGHEDVFIQVDGNVSFENAKIMSQMGANIFVAGTSSVYSKKFRINEAIDQLYKSIELRGK